MEVLRCEHLTKTYGAGQSLVTAPTISTYRYRREALRQLSEHPVPVSQHFCTCLEG